MVTISTTLNPLVLRDYLNDKDIKPIAERIRAALLERKGFKPESESKHKYRFEWKPPQLEKIQFYNDQPGGVKKMKFPVNIMYVV